MEQGAVFTWAASWRNVDLTDLELVRAARPEAVRGVGEDLADMFGSPSLAQDQADTLATVTRLYEELQPGAERLVTAGARAGTLHPVDASSEPDLGKRRRGPD